MKNVKLKICSLLVFGLLFLTQISDAQSQSNCDLGNGFAEYPVDLHNVGELAIVRISFDHNVLITSPVGFELDTSTTVVTGCLKPVVGALTGLPITFETDIKEDTSRINQWFRNEEEPADSTAKTVILDIRSVKSILFDIQRIEFGYYDHESFSIGSNGRTLYTLRSTDTTTVNLANQILGSEFSFNPATDKRVDIDDVTHVNFTPAVQVDYAKRVVTLEMTYNEGDGLIPWLEDVVSGTLNQEKTMTITDTTDGTTPISSEIFTNVLPFKYETISGFGLTTKMVVRIQLVYGCVAPG